MKPQNINITTGKVLPEMSYAHKQFLKLSFKRIDFRCVSIFSNAMRINSQRIKLVPVSEYPEYTNEQLSNLTLSDLWQLARDFGFNPRLYGCTDYQSMLSKYGERRMRLRLKAFIYTSEDNHPVRCFAVAKNTGRLVDIAKELWGYNKFSEITFPQFSLVQSLHPGHHLLKELEIQ